MNDSSTTRTHAGRQIFARLRWIVPSAFLGLTAWLLWRGVGEFNLPEVQRTLLDVPTLPALGVAALAAASVAFTGCVDLLIGRWLQLGLRARLPAPCFRRQ